MSESLEQSLRVSLITDSGGLDYDLQQFLQHNGVQVIKDYCLDDLQPENISTDDIDVLLVDLESPLNAQLPRLEWLVGRSQVPILFNAARGTPSGDTGNSLIAKLAHLARNPVSSRRRHLARRRGTASASQLISTTQSKPQLRVVEPAAQANMQAAEQVWVLGAALGGPQSVSRFLRALPGDLPLALVYAQQIGADFIPILARQMDRISSMEVLPARNGALLCHGQIVIVPEKHRFVANEEACIELQRLPDDIGYYPLIDSTMTEVAKRFGAHAGAVVFSGMGEDGSRGIREIALLGGTVWAQDAQSCQISTMPDSARRQGVVSFSGAPEQLATHLALELGESENSSQGTSD